MEHAVNLIVTDKYSNIKSSLIFIEFLSLKRNGEKSNIKMIFLHMFLKFVLLAGIYNLT